MSKPANSATEAVAPFKPLNCRALIVHDWLQGMHGSERVVHAMQELFAGGADVATFVADPRKLPEELSSRVVRTSKLGRLPGLRPSASSPGRWRYLLPFMPWWFRRLPTDGYDVVLSSSHACALGVRAPRGVPHVAYIHTPIRYVWNADLDQRVPRGARSLARALFTCLRIVDRRASTSPDVLIANSSAVRERIRSVWNRDAAVVHPPTSLESARTRQATRSPDTLLWVHRFVDYKRPLEVAQAFELLPDLNLVMVGVGPLSDRVKREAPPNVTVHGWLERDELERLLMSAAGFIHVGLEDFGISMVEALASGTPVLALNQGGALDIVRDGVDGLLIGSARPHEIASAARSMVNREWDPDLLRDRARAFSRERFLHSLRDVLVSQGLS